jgi:hypothetical protein
MGGRDSYSRQKQRRAQPETIPKAAGRLSQRRISPLYNLKEMVVGLAIRQSVFMKNLEAGRLGGGSTQGRLSVIL